MRAQVCKCFSLKRPDLKKLAIKMDKLVKMTSDRSNYVRKYIQKLSVFGDIFIRRK